MELFKTIDIPYIFLEWGFYGVRYGTLFHIPVDRSSEQYKKQEFIKHFFTSLNYIAYKDIYSTTPYKEDEPRHFDVVYIKKYN